ncbi:MULTISPECIES: poly-gamma-glutamate synthase PgsB [unclassified Streptomyces]|uniref:poly-gamma-glutamate synthase PgsB n=1 Tax=unclassified Streptomyces TaxID=2593676 RepID=UPI0038028575
MVLYLYGVFALGLSVLFLSGVVERRRHERNLDRIPVRILVNGIRGKSSITRLTAGALRGGELRVVAKTTGTAARFIHPDTTEDPVHRKFGIANVVEQIGIVRQAAAAEPDALVMECMAVQPALQEINQQMLVRSTIGVLCNVREDHLEEMGPTLDDVARSLARSMPYGGVCVTAEQQRRAVLEHEAARRDCRLVVVDPNSVTDEEMAPFAHVAFKENVAIALAVADELGIGRKDALRGMYAAPPDPGVLTVREIPAEHGTVRLANIFAANDPESTVMNFRQLVAGGTLKPPYVTLINCRPDRIERNGQMGRIVPELETDTLVLIGHPTKSARDAIPPDWPGRVLDLGGPQRNPGEIWRTITTHVTGAVSLVAIGNIHGQGERLLDHLESAPAIPAQWGAQ